MKFTLADWAALPTETMTPSEVFRAKKSAEFLSCEAYAHRVPLLKNEIACWITPKGVPLKRVLIDWSRSDESAAVDSAWSTWPPPPTFKGWIWTTREIGSRVHGTNRFERPRPMLVTMGCAISEGERVLIEREGQQLHLPEGQIVPIDFLRFDLWASMVPPPPLEHQA